MVTVPLTFPCVPAAHLQESRGPPGRKPRKSLKKVFLGLPAKSLKKVPKRSKSPQKVSKKCHFGDFSTFSGLFETLGRKAQEDFLRPFRGFRPGRPRDSCRWAAGTQGNVREEKTVNYHHRKKYHLENFSSGLKDEENFPGRW